MKHIEQVTPNVPVIPGVESALEITGGIVARAARLLSVPRTGLISRMATLEIDPDQFKD